MSMNCDGCEYDGFIMWGDKKVSYCKYFRETKQNMDRTNYPPYYPFQHGYCLQKKKLTYDPAESNPHSYYTHPQIVIFLNESEDFIHGGIAFEDKVIDLSDGETYIIGDDVEIKEELQWKDIEKPAVDDEMSYWA